MSGLDLDVDAGGQIELHQGVEGLLGRLEDVEQALVRADLELLARLLVGVRRPQHAVLVDLGGQRDRSGDLGARALGGLDDLAGRLVEQLVIVGLEPDANAWGRHDDLLVWRLAWTRSGSWSRRRRRRSCRPRGSRTATPLHTRSASPARHPP